ncbi:CPBP family intramembrane glutamic endopeptidase [Actinomyces glycerinitolerans]|uniref:Caax protease self-immunity n=1 Tax=Actinomyces glycerinitolerans TaxID=1892869 RepID=A0A1M4RV36_9ACTO|nr:type II CAAX endopeptidase family protein [Actinomyces glycerinitolerans]SHE23854.1 caax protease self-immunity [Actinomyces glycerinitolerans]
MSTRPQATFLLLTLLIAAPVTAILLALSGGPWRLLLLAFYLCALCYWRLAEQRPWRDLMYSDGRSRTWALLAVGAAAPVIGGLLLRAQEEPGYVTAVTAATPAQLVSAVGMAVLVGCCLNAIPEEVALRRVLLDPLLRRWGAPLAISATALAFVAWHLPTWLDSGLTASAYAVEVPDKLVFGLVAGWSVVRLRSLFFALGMHMGSNAVGVFLDALAPREQSWAAPDAPTVLITSAQLAAAALLVWWLSRTPNPAHGNAS